MKYINLILSLSFFSSLAISATAPNKLVTVSGAEFNLVQNAPTAMGVSYQDPWGLIWGNIDGKDNYYGPNQVNFDHASSLCSRIEINGVKGRLATVDEILRIRETMRDPSYQPGSSDKNKYDFTKIALPNFDSTTWAICKSYFDFSDATANIESCQTDGYWLYSYKYMPNAVNYMSGYRCVVETAGYKAPSLKYRVEYDRMSKLTPPDGALQPPFARLGNIEKVKLDLIVEAIGGLLSADELIRNIEPFGFYYGKPDEESQSNLALYSDSIFKSINGEPIQYLYPLELETVRKSASALENSAVANRILIELQRIEGSHNVLIGKARQIGAQMQILNTEVKKLPSSTPNSDPKLKALWVQYKAILMQAVALKPTASKNLSDFYDLQISLGPAEELGQPTLSF